MFFLPIGCLLFILLVLIFPILMALVFFGVATFSFEELGMSPTVALVLLFLTLVGSMVNIPLTRPRVRVPANFFGWWEPPRIREAGVAINVGGALVPLGISLYLLTRVPRLLPVLAATALMIIIGKLLARPVPGAGIALPAFIPPLFAALFGILFARSFAAPTAYISGVLGTLIGGDLLNLGRARRLGAGMVSIGGAGVFDGIFLVGVIAVLLTAIFH